MAKDIGLSVRRLTALESEGERPSPETLARLVEELDFPAAYFFRPDPPEVAVEATSFRSFSRLPAGRRDAALAAAAHALEVVDWVSTEFNLPSPQVPDLRGVPPMVAAAAVRSAWDLGDLPLPNLIHLLESRGVFVFSLPDDSLALDALSFWHGSRPVVFLTQHKSAERSRWDAAHELGHLVMHAGLQVHGRHTEDEADNFASALLLPETGVLSATTPNPGWSDVLCDKVDWKVSAMAYVRRLHDLDLITDWQYRTMVVEASQAGFRRREDQIERERSQLWEKVLEALSAEGLRLSDIAAQLALTPDELGAMIFRLQALPGGAQRKGPPAGRLSIVPNSPRRGDVAG